MLTTRHKTLRKFWVALEEPLRPIPEVPEDVEPADRRIVQFYDRCQGEREVTREYVR